MSIIDNFRRALGLGAAPVVERAAAPALIGPPAPPPELLYYCWSGRCHQPRKLVNLHFGCNTCVAPLLTYPDLAFKGVPERIWHEQLPCPRHPPLLLHPRCPDCGGYIEEDSWVPPLLVHAGPNAGKTAFCASLAWAVDNLLSGIVAINLQDRSSTTARYRIHVSNLLHDGKKVPDKSPVGGAFHTYVVRMLDRGTGRGFVLPLTDLAGETWASGAYEATAADWVRMAQSYALLAERSVFLLNPELPGALTGYTRRDHFGTLRKLHLDIEVVASAADASEARRRWDAMEAILDQEAWPVGDPERVARRIVDEVCRDAPAAKLIDSLRTLAASAAEKSAARDDLRQLHLFMSRGRVAAGQKLNHKIAVVVAKSDLLGRDDDGEPVRPSYAKILAPLLPSPSQLRDPNWLPAKIGEWRGPVDACSAAGRASLFRHGARDLVEWLEDNFSEVGYFFASALGTRVQPGFAKEARPNASVSADALRGLDLPGAEVFEVPAPPSDIWGVKMLPGNGPGGVQRPNPEDVLLPLLWQMTR